MIERSESEAQKQQTHKHVLKISYSYGRLPRSIPEIQCFESYFSAWLEEFQDLLRSAHLLANQKFILNRLWILWFSLLKKTRATWCRTKEKMQFIDEKIETISFFRYPSPFQTIELLYFSSTFCNSFPSYIGKMISVPILHKYPFSYPLSERK